MNWREFLGAREPFAIQFHRNFTWISEAKEMKETFRTDCPPLINEWVQILIKIRPNSQVRLFLVFTWRHETSSKSWLFNFYLHQVKEKFKICWFTRFQLCDALCFENRAVWISEFFHIAWHKDGRWEINHVHEKSIHLVFLRPEQPILVCLEKRLCECLQVQQRDEYASARMED